MSSTALITVTGIFWSDKSIGIAERKLADSNMIVVTTKDKNGKRLYENPFRMTRDEVMSYPQSTIEKYGTKLRQVPLSELHKYEVVEGKSDAKDDIVY